MGGIIEGICCINNQEILYNQNYPNSFNSNSIRTQYQTLKDNEMIRLPSNQINLGNSHKEKPLNKASKIPISVKDVIIQKKGDPFQDYEIIKKIGEGTYGKVYKVKNKHNNTIRAMKVIGKKFINNLNDSEVGKEIEILKTLQHPYIIKLFEYYVNNDSIFLISELCEEGDLHTKINKIGKFPEFIVKIIMLQVFKALMYLSEKNVIHGDLKLENILVDCYDDDDNDDSDEDDNDNNVSSDKNKKNNKNKEDGFINAIKHDIIMIMNDGNMKSSFNIYGSAKSYDSKINLVNKKLLEKERNGEGYNSRTKFRKTENNIKNIIINNKDIPHKLKSIYDSKKLKIFNYGVKLIDFGCSKILTRYKKHFNDIIGTLVYCSPEVLANDYNQGCDVWACGVLMYILLSGYFPFYGKDEETIKNKILSGKIEFDVALFNSVSDEAKDLIKKCLKYDVGRRISIPEALNHRFFHSLKNSNKFTDDEIKKLKSLKLFKENSKFYQLVFTYLSYNFSDNKLLNNLNSIYSKIDRNNDWKITKGELFKAYKTAGITITKEEVDRIINIMDFNKNGIIEYDEFIRMCIPREKLFTEENLENAFLLFDKDKKGFITPQEIIDIIQANRNISDEVKQEFKEEILEVADEIIDCREFKNLMISLSGFKK